MKLDAVETAIHLSALQPASLLLLDKPLRKIIVRFQERVQALNLIELLPKVKVLNETHKRRHQDGLHSADSISARSSPLRYDATPALSWEEA